MRSRLATAGGRGTGREELRHQSRARERQGMEEREDGVREERDYDD